MNAAKNPRQAEKLAKEAKKLQEISKKNPDKLRGKDKAKAQRKLVLDNLDNEETDSWNG